MAVPEFTNEGLLPAGIHSATVQEVVARFGGPSSQRRVIAESLTWAVNAARRAGVSRFVIDGSFVDAKREPNDVDCVLLFGHDYPKDSGAARELEEGFPYVQIVLFQDEPEFKEFLEQQFGTDRRGRPRGLVEVQL